MIKEIFKPKLTEILPASIKHDEKLHAAAVALDEEIEKLLSLSELVLHLPRLDNLPHEVLDHLAWQYHCDFYSQNLPIQVKRNQIRETIFYHRIKGTPAGVERSIKDFLVDAKVEENWEYGGEPYFFRITCKGLKYIPTEEDFLYLVFNAKNVRSWLEGIIFDLTLEENEIYHVAHLEVDAGKEFHDIFLENMQAHEKNFVGFLEVEACFDIFDLTK